MNRAQFVQILLNMPFTRLVDFIYWDNHGGDCMDIEPSDWTMAMVLHAINNEDWESFADSYAVFLMGENITD